MAKEGDSGPFVLKREPNQHIIDELEEALDAARDGRISYLLILTDERGKDGTPACGTRAAGPINMPAMLFAFERFKYLNMPELTEVE